MKKLKKVIDPISLGVFVFGIFSMGEPEFFGRNRWFF